MPLNVNGQDILTVKVTETHEVYRNLWLKGFVERHFKTPEAQRKAWIFLAKFRRRFPKIGKKLRGELVYRQEIK